LDKLTFYSIIPFKRVSTGDLTSQQHFDNLLPQGNLFGLGNYEVAFKYSLYDKGVNISVSLNSSFNTIRKDLDKGLSTGYDANSVGLTSHIGKKLENKFWYLNIGYHKFSNNFSDQIKIKAEYLWRMKNPLKLGLALDAQQSFRNGSYYNENSVQTGIFPNDQEFIALRGKLVYENKKGLGANLLLPLLPLQSNYIGLNGKITFGIYKKI
jgi:hypothetical protein